MNSRFPQYTTDYISGVMSLRKPQEESLKILEDITENISIKEGMNLKAALAAINAMCPTCSDFERDFLSITFALATGVGKTRLMGAFIAFLYTRYNMRNFFVVAPNTTIYDKLKRDLNETTSPKYVFKGLGCFSSPPQIITDTDYKDKTINMFESEIRIFIYNIDKFNKEDASMKKVNEIIGDSFYSYLSALDDLVLIMDESHHYRAKRGAAALNELHPILGLELTATPLVAKGSKQVPFKNVVYEYPLSKAIEDGYTRTPYAVTRSDIEFYNFGDEQIDTMMLNDGIACHERAKAKLAAYADNYGLPKVKPFMLVVCKDTDHAQWVNDYIKSDKFMGGKYQNKTIIVHSKQKGSETDANTKLLLDVERPDNPVEIVIHVNMLKDGWDVNNLYTIVPLRTAASKILREQMVGRGLRLPYGKRTGDKDVDSVMLTAHDKFSELLAEAQRGDSIFKAGNVIKAEEIKPQRVSVATTALGVFSDEELEKAYEQIGMPKNVKNDELIRVINSETTSEVEYYIQSMPNEDDELGDEEIKSIVEEIKTKVGRDDKDLSDLFQENETSLADWINNNVKRVHKEAIGKFIPIPRIRAIDEGIEEYYFIDFNLTLGNFRHTPIKNELLIQNLEDMHDRVRIQGNAIDFEGYEPKRAILEIVREKPEIDYERCSGLLYKLISQVTEHYEKLHGINGMQNIVMMYKREIANEIYEQMMQHFYSNNETLQEEVIDMRRKNKRPTYTWDEKTGLYGSYEGDIRNVLFDGILKGVFSTAKFDTSNELMFARILEGDREVINWLRPAAKEFDITYNRGKRYVPDFVVETEDVVYLVEIKGEDRLQNPDVIAKKQRAIQYCDTVTLWGKANGHKEWRYLFIPDKKVQPSSSFMKLASDYCEL